jgi:hypothetical protein
MTDADYARLHTRMLHDAGGLTPTYDEAVERFLSACGLTTDGSCLYASFVYCRRDCPLMSEEEEPTP